MSTITKSEIEILIDKINNQISLRKDNGLNSMNYPQLHQI